MNKENKGSITPVIREYNKTIHLHGRKEIEDFFRDEYRGNEEALQKCVNSLLEEKEGTHFGLPYEIKIDETPFLQNRRVVGIVIHHNECS